MTARQGFGVWLLCSIIGILGYFVHMGLSASDETIRIICAVGILAWVIASIAALLMNLVINIDEQNFD